MILQNAIDVKVTLSRLLGHFCTPSKELYYCKSLTEKYRNFNPVCLSLSRDGTKWEEKL